jgi:prepilin-type N-terminal cleavage/methylation domain-containing protein
MVSGTARPPEREKGFSLIEVLVVVAIMGMLAVILTVATSKTLKRQRLESAALQLKGFMDRAYVLTAQQGRGVFVEITPVQTNGTRIVRLVEDTDEDRTLDPTDQELDREILTSDLVLANDPAAATAWPVLGSGSLALLCDTLGRAVNPNNGQQVTSGARVSLTHKEMTGSGTLRPVLTFTIEVTPLWRPTSSKKRG